MKFNHSLIIIRNTERYIAPSGKFRKRFLGIVCVELDIVCVKKWNAERVIVFQSVILKRAEGVKNSAQIRKRILFRLDCWNRGLFDELMKDTYNPAMGYLGKFRGAQTKKQYITFLNLILNGKLRKADRFFCDREKVGVFNQ